MANIKSQIKRNRQNEKRTERNKAVRSELKTRTKTAVEAADRGRRQRRRAGPRCAMKRIDKAAAKGVIHKNAGRPPQVPPGQEAQPGHRRRADPLARHLRHRGQAGHEHLEHEVVRPGLAAPEVEVGLGEQVDRPARCGRGPRRRAWPSAFLAGKVEPFMPSSSAASFSPATSAPSRRSMRA